MIEDLRVCFVGDSFVAGVGDPEHRGWTGRIAARTHRSGQPLTAYVLGVRRQTSAQVAERWRAECAVRLPPFCDGRVVVAFGVNDATVENGLPRVPEAESAVHLEHLVGGARDAGWPVLVVGPPPIADAAQNERIGRLDAMFRSVCAAAATAYVPVFAALLDDPDWMREVRDGDGAHPAAPGYEALADLVWPFWNAWIDDRRR